MSSTDDYKSIFDNIKNRYILNHIFEYIPQKKCLSILKYNKVLQNKLNMGKKYYKDFFQIEIKIIPVQPVTKYINTFINIHSNKSYYHIYFNDEKEEIKRNYYHINDKVTKIKILIDYEVKIFLGLFEECNCIESINFLKFNRNDITNLDRLFFKCSSLKEVNLSKLDTTNAITMESMFSDCSSLIQLNLSNFNTNKVFGMRDVFWMFIIKISKFI